VLRKSSNNYKCSFNFWFRTRGCLFEFIWTFIGPANFFFPSGQDKTFSLSKVEFFLTILYRKAVSHGAGLFPSWVRLWWIEGSAGSHAWQQERTFIHSTMPCFYVYPLTTSRALKRDGVLLWLGFILKIHLYIMLVLLRCCCFQPTRLRDYRRVAQFLLRLWTWNLVNWWTGDWQEINFCRFCFV
jgi:hypothetical protein